MRKFVSVSIFAAMAVACDHEPTNGTPATGPGTPTEPTDPTPTDPSPDVPEDPHARDEIDPPFLVSRFAPVLGMAGNWVTLLTAFDSAGCAENKTCSVTIDGVAAEIADDTYNLEVIVPNGASTGPLCVTWHDRTECSGDFTILFAPVITMLSPDRISAGHRDFVLEVYGNGFRDDIQVWADQQRLETNFISSERASAVVPYALIVSPKPLVITVFSPTSARCGVRSEPVVLTVE